MLHLTGDSSFLELYPDSVFQFVIGWYFPGIFPTDTKRKLGQDVLVLYIWRNPFFPQREASAPFLMDQAPLLREK
jgi:hypothetical protein